ncbi:hypothetical protein GBAR_LOCUS12445 [Geodia barretti]|uniref:Uncharacterized protein n=1 Tax=Geodia barretti TaxID=519541 RepID=A0AA35WNG1_GEOBA|nr:hypothetical protein GBAR_LOCUS12445 [Geodia barretti]
MKNASAHNGEELFCKVTFCYTTVMLCTSDTCNNLNLKGSSIYKKSR